MLTSPSPYKIILVTYDVLADAHRRCAAYVAALPQRLVRPDPDAVARLSALDGELPVSGTPDGEVLRLLDEYGSPATMATAGPRFFGFVTGGSLPATLGANWLAGAWDQNAGFDAESPASSMLERVSLRWLVDLLGLPAGTGGGFVTGATMANFTALAAARHAVLAAAGWNVEADGLFGAPPVTVVVGQEVHSSLVKALGLLGFGRDRVIRVPVDDQGRMRADALAAVTGPTIVCTQVGNVNTGAADPVGEISAAVRPAGAWVHVDAAFGLWAAAAPARAYLTEGVGDADSWATDAHKWLNVAYDSGLAFVREPDLLRNAMAVTAAYLPPPGDQRQPMAYTPELSRRARGVEVWAALRGLGRSGVADLVERCCAYAARFAERLAAAGYEILNDVVLNQVLVSFGTPEVTTRVIDAVQAEGTCWCGGTIWQGRTAMRISVSSWATTERDVDRSIDAILAAGKAVAAA